MIGLPVTDLAESNQFDTSKADTQKLARWKDRPSKTELALSPGMRLQLQLQLQQLTRSRRLRHALIRSRPPWQILGHTISTSKTLAAPPKPKHRTVICRDLEDHRYTAAHLSRFPCLLATYSAPKRQLRQLPGRMIYQPSFPGPEHNRSLFELERPPEVSWGRPWHWVAASRRPTTRG